MTPNSYWTIGSYLFNDSRIRHFYDLELFATDFTDKNVDWYNVGLVLVIQTIFGVKKADGAPDNPWKFWNFKGMYFGDASEYFWVNTLWALYIHAVLQTRKPVM